jgi:hypothetical protein
MVVAVDDQQPVGSQQLSDERAQGGLLEHRRDRSLGRLLEPE